MQSHPKLIPITLLVIFSATLVLASPLPPCVKVTTSRTGSFLVLSEFQLEAEEGGVHRINRVTLNVLPKEDFINEKDRITGPGTYWTDWTQWSVVLDPRSLFVGCPLSLITDDGEFLVVIGAHDAPTFALRLYRRREHTGQLTVAEGPDYGVLVRNISLSEIWPADKLREAAITTDATPQWFSGGTFEFSPDNRALIHKTRWGNIVSVNLQNGSVSKK